MPRVTQLQTNFTAGEISPRLHGRVDIARYQNGVEALRNLVAQIYGGVKRRPGTLFVRAAKVAGNQARLVPFVRDYATAYMLEFGATYIRVYKNGAVVESSPGVPYEIATPYTTAQVLALDYTQGADTMFLFHEAVAPYKLVCAGDTSWTLSAVTFVEQPFQEPGTYPATTLFPGRTGSVGESINLVVGAITGPVLSNTTFAWAAGVATCTCNAHGLTTGDLVKIEGAIPNGWNSATAVTVTGANTYTYPLPIDPGPSTAAGTTQEITGAAIFSAGSVGSSVKVNGGVVRITTYTNASAVVGVVKQELSSSVSAGRDAWSLHAPAWSASNGYPRTGTLHEQRLICAGSTAFPQTVWGSVTGAYLDFSQGTNDDAAFAFTIASDVQSAIRYVATSRALLALTSNGEFTIAGGTERPLAPTNAQIKQRTNYGCADVRPVRIRDSELFVQRAGRKVRSLTYSLANDDWVGPDLSVLAEHLTEGGVAGLTWQQEPDSIVWIARTDGSLASITLDKDQDVTAWALHDLGGAVESVASVPTATGDEVWLIVRRTVGGATVRYLERLSETTTMDASIVASGAAATVWGGLTHLEGETVHVVADGSYAGSFTVAGGQVTLGLAASAVNIGRNYRPRLKLLPPEIQTGMGSASGNAMRTSEVTARFFETTGCHVNGKALHFRTTGAAVLDQPPVPFTGIKRIENLGWGRGEDELEFTQEEPMPFHLLSVTRKFTTNDG